MAARHRQIKRQLRETAPAVVPCGECFRQTRMVGGQAIYPHRPDLCRKNFWLCECGAYVGCHDGTTHPLGIPAGKETQRARRAAHAAFDPLWRSQGLSRPEAYRWLSEQLGIEPERTHIGMFDAATARRVVEVCEARRVPA